MEKKELPISRPIKFEELKGGNLDVEISANSGQLKRLAQWCGLLEVKRFSAKLNVAVWHNTGLEVSGMLDSKIVQECVATLAPVENAINIEFCVRFVPELESRKHKERLGADLTIDIELDETEPPEGFNGSDLDLGQIVAEQLAVSIDPFPRAKDANFEDFLSETVDSDYVNSRKPSAFAELAKLKHKLK